ncbi:Proline-rich protein 13 [Myotis davidii]|uniref:Proline-rich protein 13 n=1 Tax=Myotis davidii TaxID=225400 RepID=L5MC24_MYODS|nr:Proline-rich protein 13 [Myotis davidii]
MWNPSAGQPGPNPYPPNVGYPGGSNPAHPPPVNPAFPPGPFPTPLGPFPTPPGAPQGNPAFPPVGPPYPVPPPAYPGYQPSGPYPPPYPPPAPGMPPINPLAPGMVAPGMVTDKKIRKKMKKAQKKSQAHHKHGKITEFSPILLISDGCPQPSLFPFIHVHCQLPVFTPGLSSLATRGHYTSFLFAPMLPLYRRLRHVLSAVVSLVLTLSTEPL